VLAARPVVLLFRYVKLSGAPQLPTPAI